MDTVDCIVVGGGVVGLACARALAQAGREVVVLEAATACGTVTSARNSGVIHAGLYYEPGSLRARLCVAGRRALYAFCATRGVEAQACGKLIVATDEAELDTLSAIAARAEANGVEGLSRLSAHEVARLEPALRCTGALFSATTGILDGHGYMLALRADAEAAGAVVVCGTPVLGGESASEGLIVRVGGPEPATVRCALLVNAAGLGACALAGGIDGLDAAHVPRAYLSRGNYFALAGPSPFRHLVYPVPIPGGAGIHLTLDLGGQARFGPDVEAVDRLDYRVDPARAAHFYAAIRRYWPGLPEGALRPDYAGIRPKIVPPTQTQDFIIEGPAEHGTDGLINLFGIESPGLTASLAIADHVAAMAP